jgi:hypothetical protein
MSPLNKNANTFSAINAGSRLGYLALSRSPYPPWSICQAASPQDFHHRLLSLGAYPWFEFHITGLFLCLSLAQRFLPVNIFSYVL